MARREGIRLVALNVDSEALAKASGRKPILFMSGHPVAYD
jgi:hypothetical protein